MALSLPLIYNIIKDPGDFDSRVLAAMYIASANVLSEIGTTQNHTERLALAKRILVDENSLVRYFRPYILIDSSVTVAADIVNVTKIQTIVTNSFTTIALAGV